jgi:hypothetical protein
MLKVLPSFAQPKSVFLRLGIVSPRITIVFFEVGLLGTYRVVNASMHKIVFGYSLLFFFQPRAEIVVVWVKVRVYCACKLGV